MIMMALTERMIENGRCVAGAAGVATAKAPSANNDSKESIQFLTDELNALRRDQAKLQQAVFEAAQVQRRLCAPRELNWGGFEISGEIFPVRHLSGDFFKVMELRSVLGVVVGDIAGKGLTAGIWQAHLMGLVQRSARRHADPGDAVAEVNHELCHSDGEPPMTALFFARIDPRKNEITYCNAGLPAPLVLSNNKVRERLDEGGPMLGGVKNGSFRTGSAALNPGDMLVAYSDGVTECRNTEDDEFAMERLTAAATAVSGVSASKALFSLLGTVLDFADTSSANDDLTLLIVRRRDAISNERPRKRAKNLLAPRRRTASVSRPKNSRGDTVSDN
jgi:serine phosphatase RsbU (regulator of sigma subunit)